MPKPIQNALCLTLLTCLLALLPTSAIAEESGEDANLQREQAAVWQYVDRLAETYSEPWHAGVGHILGGGFLIWIGGRQLAAYSRSDGSGSRPFSFPVFGLLSAISGSSSIAAGVHRMATTSPEADHARRLANSGLPPRAGLLYLQHRAQDARRSRVRDGVTQIASGAGGITYLLLVPVDSQSQRTTVLVAGSAVAAITVGFGIYRLASKSLEERLYERAKSEGTQTASRPRIVPTIGPATAGADGSASGVEAGLNLQLEW